jgi:transcriptional regulator with XRE-family HTH domain
MNAHPQTADIIHLVPTTDGPAIRIAREAKGWSQAELAEKTGTYQQMVDRIEKGLVKRSKLVPALRAAVGLDTICSMIRAGRKALSLGQADIAYQLDVTVQAVSQWERDETMPSGINLLKLSDVLGFDLPHSVALIPDQNKLSELREQIEEVIDLLHALDKIGDGIGEADGFAVSAVALNAKSIAENVLDGFRAMGGKA